jgi:hypothetical protein
MQVAWMLDSQTFSLQNVESIVMANQRVQSRYLSLRDRIPLMLMTLSAFMGFLGLFFLTQTELPLIFYIANGIMHIPLVLGWIIITFKNKLERRLHPFWTPYSLFMIIFVATTVYFTSLQPHGVSGFLTLSETFWYALAYGSLFAFYKLESANPLWYFMFFLAVFWNLQTVVLTAQALGIQWTMEGPPTLQSYFIYSDDFWDTWGWFISDMILDVPMAIIPIFYIIKGIKTKLKH